MAYGYYGQNLWFDPVGTTENLEPQVYLDQSDQSEFLDILAIDIQVDEVESWDTSGDPHDILEGEALPFIWKKLQIDEEEESMEDIRTMQAWAVDISNSKYIATMLKWLKQSGLESDVLSHLKRIRKRDGISTLLLSVSSSVPVLPTNIDIGDPYQISVPCNPALTQTSLILKNTLWPTVYAPRRKWEPEKWSIAKVQWARNAINHILRNAETASSDELPVVAYVPKPFEDEALLSRSFTAKDTRISTGHPLRHAAMNIIRNVADWRAQTSPADLLSDPLKPATSPSNGSLGISDTSCNGVNYLLTGLTLFITHEPCIMCSMALLHSRVKEVFYIVPMPRTGGCGGSACLSALKGVNHRYSIAHWRQKEGSAPAHLDEQIDV